MADDTLVMQVGTVSGAGARRALEAAQRKAVEMGARLSIAVVDNAGHLVAFHRMDGAPVISIEVAQRKAQTAAYLRLPTKAFEDMLHGGSTFLLAFSAIAPSQGGIPLAADTVVVGGIGASGGTREQDELAALAGAEALAGG